MSRGWRSRSSMTVRLHLRRLGGVKQSWVLEEELVARPSSAVRRPTRASRRRPRFARPRMCSRAGAGRHCRSRVESQVEKGWVFNEPPRSSPSAAGVRACAGSERWVRGSSEGVEHPVGEGGSGRAARRWSSRRLTRRSARRSKGAVHLGQRQRWSGTYSSTCTQRAASKLVSSTGRDTASPGWSSTRSCPAQRRAASSSIAGLVSTRRRPRRPDLLCQLGAVEARPQPTSKMRSPGQRRALGGQSDGGAPRRRSGTAPRSSLPCPRQTRPGTPALLTSSLDAGARHEVGPKCVKPGEAASQPP